MSDVRLCRDCVHCVAPRRLLGLLAPDWSMAKCGRTGSEWTDTVSGETGRTEPRRCAWERAGSFLRIPGDCGPDAVYFEARP